MSQDIEGKFPRKLTKKEVDSFINRGEAVYDEMLSNEFNFKVYKFIDGRLIFRRDNGTGAYWRSQSQINEVAKKAEIEADILNLNNWLNDTSDLVILSTSALEVLGKKIGEEVNYQQVCLKMVSAIKIKNIIADKELFYAMLLYSCNYFIQHYKGELSFNPAYIKTGIYVPCVVMPDGKIFVPYSEFLKSYTEPQKISLMESVELERVKYKFMGN